MKGSGCFLVLDGPSGVGKSTVTALLADRLSSHGYPVVATAEPSPGPIGVFARGGTHRFQGLSLACLVAADRYHHLDTEIRPALRAGKIVMCDRYLPTSLVLQPLDQVPPTFVWQLNLPVDPPDLTIILTGDPQECVSRAALRHLQPLPPRPPRRVRGLSGGGRPVERRRAPDGQLRRAEPAASNGCRGPGRSDPPAGDDAVRVASPATCTTSS